MLLRNAKINICNYGDCLNTCGKQLHTYADTLVWYAGMKRAALVIQLPSCKIRQALHYCHKGNAAAKPSRVQQAGSSYLIFSGGLYSKTQPNFFDIITIRLLLNEYAQVIN